MRYVASHCAHTAYPCTKAIILKNVQRVSSFNRDKWLRTSLTFFWRSTICERRCVISSCCREASSLFRASSSDRDVICRLELPGMTDGIQIGSKDLLLMGGSDEFSAVLTQFFDTVVDKLLLLFLIRDCFCLQVTRLMQNKQVGMTHCIMLINNTPYKITGVAFRSFSLWKTIRGLIKTQPATPLFSEISLGKIPGESLFYDIFMLELIFNTGFDSLESFGFSDRFTSKSRWKSSLFAVFLRLTVLFFYLGAQWLVFLLQIFEFLLQRVQWEKRWCWHIVVSRTHTVNTRGTCESAGRSHMLWNCGQWHLMCRNEDGYQSWASHMRREINHKSCCYFNAFISVLVKF